MTDTITGKIIKNYLENNSLEFKSTHFRLSLPIINRIYKKMVNEVKFDDIKICDDVIIDGHHRFIASLFAKVEIGKSLSHKTSATIEYEWKNVEFTEQEWDTQEHILYLNQLDAQFNNIELEKIIELSK